MVLDLLRLLTFRGRFYSHLQQGLQQEIPTDSTVFIFLVQETVPGVSTQTGAVSPEFAMSPTPGITEIPGLITSWVEVLPPPTERLSCRPKCCFPDFRSLPQKELKYARSTN